MNLLCTASLLSKATRSLGRESIVATDKTVCAANSAFSWYNQPAYTGESALGVRWPVALTSMENELDARKQSGCYRVGYG